MTRKQRRRRVAAVTSLSLVGLLLVGLIALRAFVRPPGGGIGELDPGAFPDDWDYGVPDDVNALDDVITLLIAGTDDFHNTDSIMVATINQQNETASFISIPRDTIIPTTTRSLKKINGALGTGASRSNGTTLEERRMDGFRLLQQEVSMLVGFVPRYFVGVGIEGVADIVDEIGGVEFNVPVRMRRGGRDELGARIDLEPGLQRLNGKQSVMLLRFRGYGPGFPGYGGEGPANDDFGRMKTQQEFLRVLARQSMDNMDIGLATALLNFSRDRVKSNMDAGQMAGLLEQIWPWIGNEGALSFYTLPTVGVSRVNMTKWNAFGGRYGRITGAHYQQVRREEALALINRTINPFDRDIDWVNFLDIS